MELAKHAISLVPPPELNPDGTRIATTLDEHAILQPPFRFRWKGENNMAQTYTIKFIHRINGDGSIDSICRECFVTIATAYSRSELARDEQAHACEPVLLERYKKVMAH
jgi:hypothetical protein